MPETARGHETPGVPDHTDNPRAGEPAFVFVPAKGRAGSRTLEAPKCPLMGQYVTNAVRAHGGILLSLKKGEFCYMPSLPDDIMLRERSRSRKGKY